MKRTISILLFLVMLLGLGLVSAHAAVIPNQGRVFTHNKISYQVVRYSSEALTCLGPAFYTTKDGRLKQYEVKNIVVPARVAGMKVTRIDFDTNDSPDTARNAIQSLSIPDTVTSLSGFKNCKNLKTVTGGKNVTTTEFGTFAGTEYKAAAVKKDKYGAFYFNNTLLSCNGKIRKLVIRDGATIMSQEVLKNQKIESITFSKTFKDFGAAWDKDYDGLSRVWVDSDFRKTRTLKEIKVDKDNPYYTAKDGVLYNKDMTKLIWYPCCKEDRIFTVPDSVTRLERNCFFGNSSLFYVKLPDGLKSIERLSFSHLSNLKSVYIPASVNYINGINGGFGYFPNTRFITEKGSFAENYLKNDLFLETEDGDRLYLKITNPCEKHTYKTVKGTAPTTCSYGWSDYQQCTVCGMIKGFQQLPKTDLPKNVFKLAGDCGRFKVKMLAQQGATGFEVYYATNGKAAIQTFEATETVIKTINKLQPGVYSVRVRTFAVKSGVTVFSTWTGTKSVKVK